MGATARLAGTDSTCPQGTYIEDSGCAGGAGNAAVASWRYPIDAPVSSKNRVSSDVPAAKSASKLSPNASGGDSGAQLAASTQLTTSMPGPRRNKLIALTCSVPAAGTAGYDTKRPWSAS